MSPGCDAASDQAYEPHPLLATCDLCVPLADSSRLRANGPHEILIKLMVMSVYQCHMTEHSDLALG